jgi:hypothetical protein
MMSTKGNGDSCATAVLRFLAVVHRVIREEYTHDQPSPGGHQLQ